MVKMKRNLFFVIALLISCFLFSCELLGESRTYKITYVLNGGLCEDLVSTFKSNETVTLPTPTQENHEFAGWYLDEEFLEPIEVIDENKNYTVYCKWLKYYNTVNFEYGDYLFMDKLSLSISFYSDFYKFINTSEEGVLALETYNITSFEEFYSFCYTWQYLDRSDLYHVGDAFAPFYLTIEEDGLIENQPTSTFIGYCYQNGMYVDFIEHLMTFFAYWRTDEGYTTPTNHGNDFFYSAWASLVDTAKFFYFSSSTLNSKYPWFNSARVKDALDNIPCIVNEYIPSSEVGDGLDLFSPTRTGYTFVGWYQDKEFSGEKIERIEKNNLIETLYAKWEKENNNK